MRQLWFGSVTALLAGVSGAFAQDIPEIAIVLTTAEIVEPERLPDPAPAKPLISTPTQLPDVTQAKPLAPTVPTPAKLPDPAAPPCVNYLPDPCCVCRCGPRFWGGIDYLLWTVKDAPLNAAIFTQGSTNLGLGRPGVPPSGAIGAAGTSVYYGADKIDFDTFNGGRIELGGWLNSTRTIGLEGRAFLLERGSQGFAASSGPNDTLAFYRPVKFESPFFQGEFAGQVTQPPFTLGSIYANASTHLWGAEVNAVINCRDRSQYRVDWLAGFRYVDLHETLTIGAVSNFVGNPIGPGAAPFVSETLDGFSTRNQFYGPQVGARVGADFGRVVLSAGAKIAFGVTHEVQSIAGFNTINGFQSPFAGGFLTTTSNEGQLVRDRFAVVPEFGGKISYRLTERLTASAGYDFLYVSNVIRPGDQVDRVIQFTANGTQVRPAATAVPGDFFAHGVSLGLGMTY